MSTPRPSCLNLFVYGTLCSESLRRRLIGRRVCAVPARLEGFRVWRVRGEDYPALCPAPGGRVDGMVLIGLRPLELRRLDRYEGGEYVRRLCRIEVNGRSCRAWVYLWRGRLKRLQALTHRRNCCPDRRYSRSSVRPQ